MSFSREIQEHLLVRCGRHCCLCRRFVGSKMEIHHIIPRSDGGSDDEDNAIPLCYDCHSDVHSNAGAHPKDKRYPPSELKAHRDAWFKRFAGIDLDALITFFDTRREEIEAKNMADTLAYQAEKLLRDNKDKIPAELNTEAEAKIAAVKSALNGTDTEAIKSATQELNEVMQKIGQAVYSQQQPPPEGGEAPPPPGEDGGEGEGTVEGEFREV